MRGFGVDSAEILPNSDRGKQLAGRQSSGESGSVLDDDSRKTGRGDRASKSCGRPGDPVPSSLAPESVVADDAVPRGEDKARSIATRRGGCSTDPQEAPIRGLAFLYKQLNFHQPGQG